MRRLLKNVSLGVTVFVMAISLTGCFGSNVKYQTNPIDDILENSVARLEISIDWEKFGSSNEVKGMAFSDGSDVTHVGVRLEYPSESAAYMQSVARDPAKSQRIITMEVSPVKTTKANLYLLAVEHNHDKDWTRNRARYLGVYGPFVLQDKNIRSIEMDEIRWVEACWRVSPGDESLIYVSDPYRPEIGEEIGWNQSFVGIDGTANIGANIEYRGERWRKFYDVDFGGGRGHGPYVDGQKFNLPLRNGGYLIEQQAGS